MTEILPWDADGGLASTAELPQALDPPSQCAAREREKSIVRQ